MKLKGFQKFAKNKKRNNISLRQNQNPKNAHFYPQILKFKLTIFPLTKFFPLWLYYAIKNIFFCSIHEKVCSLFVLSYRNWRWCWSIESHFFLFVDWMERHKWHLMVTELFYINDFFLLLFYRIIFYSVVFMAICEFFIVQNRIIDETILCIKINAWHKINQWNFIFDIFAAKFIFYCMSIFGEKKIFIFFCKF